MWLGLQRSRSATVGHEADDIVSDMTKQASQIIDGRRNAIAQPARQALPDVGKCARAVDLEQRVGGRTDQGGRVFADLSVALTECFHAQQRTEIVAEDLRGEILLMRQPAQSGDGFKRQSMLDPFERFLNSPPLVVQGGEVRSGPCLGIEQTGGQHTHAALGCHEPDEAHRDRRTFNLVVARVRAVWRWQRHDRLACTAAQERCDGSAADAVNAHAEVNRAHLECGHQPGRGITAVQHEQVILAQQIEVLEQHLPLAGISTVQRRMQHHLDAGQVQREDLGKLDHATRGIARSQPHIARVGGHHAQPVPARHADVLVDERKQMLRQIGEHGVRQVLPGFRKCLGACASHQFGLVMQHREEAVELSLNAGPVAAEKPADQYGEVQLAAPAEMPRIGNMTRTQFRRMKVADEPAQYRDNPSSYREIVRITTFRILPAQPRVYKPLRLKLIGLGRGLYHEPSAGI